MTLFLAMLLVIAAGLVWGRRFGRSLAAAGLIGLVLCASDPVALVFVRTLERGYAAGPPTEAADVIVVLGSETYPPNPSQPEILPGYGTYLRCHHAALLHRTWKPLPVVATAGPVVSFGEKVDGTIPMRRVLESEGVPASLIWVENESANTLQNAAHTARMLRAKGLSRIVLVTEAYHMKRAKLAFERQGLTVTPAACAFRAARFEGTWREYLLPKPSTLLLNQMILHEWLGVIWQSAVRKG
jgi:uncharacterized SAM-binding protein YcdF (DUF218 family)